VDTQFLAPNSEGKRPLERAKQKWEYIIKIDFKEICCESVDWIV
jgi:hypothetical protein